MMACSELESWSSQFPELALMESFQRRDLQPGKVQPSMERRLISDQSE